MTRVIPSKLIEDTARELMARAAIDIPPDYREGVRQARDLERSKLPRFVLTEMLENWNIATAERRPMCADTGLTTVGYGLGATYGRSIKRVIEVHWLKDLRIAQALWVLEVERLGPFLVEGDRAGRSLFALANREINARLREVYRDLPPFAMGRFGEQTSCEEEIV